MENNIMSPIKVLLVATEAGPAMASFAAAIINALGNDSRFSVKSIVMNHDSRRTYEGKLIKQENVYTVNAPQSLFSKIIYKIWPRKVISYIKGINESWKPEKILFLTGDCQLSLFSLLHPSKKYAYVVHDLYSHEVHIRNLKEKLLNMWIKYGYRAMRYSADSLTTCSLFQLNQLKKMYPHKQVNFTNFPSLINDQGKYGEKSVGELEDVSNYVLFFGGINLYKGVELLIEAFVKSGVCKNYKLVIAGRGTPLVYEPNESIIRIDRFIEDCELRDLFTKAALVVYPYKSITMSGVLSFPYYFGNKVLLSDVPFFLQNKTENTFYFKSQNVQDLEEKLKQVLNISKNASAMFAYDNIFSEKQLIDSYYVFLRDKE